MGKNNGATSIDPIDRIASHTKIVGSCWETDYATSHGYPVIQLRNPRMIRQVNQVVWELLRGPIKHQLNHSCNNTKCWKPFPGHCYDGTQTENVRDAKESGTYKNGNTDKTHCYKGHEFTIENTYIRPDIGSRVCKQCRALTLKKFRGAIL